MDKKQPGVIKAVNKFLPWYFEIIQIRYHSWLFLDQFTKYMYQVLSTFGLQNNRSNISLSWDSSN